MRSLSCQLRRFSKVVSVLHQRRTASWRAYVLGVWIPAKNGPFASVGIVAERTDFWLVRFFPISASSQLLSLAPTPTRRRSEEHTSELQSLMRISYAVFCLKKKSKYHIVYTQLV